MDVACYGLWAAAAAAVAAYIFGRLYVRLSRCRVDSLLRSYDCLLHEPSQGLLVGSSRQAKSSSAEDKREAVLEGGDGNDCRARSGNDAKENKRNASLFSPLPISPSTLAFLKN